MQSSFADIFYWLAATRLEGVGPVRLKRWLEQYGDLKTLFAAPHIELRVLGLTPRQIHGIKHPEWHVIEKDLEWCEKVNCHLVSMLDDNYPFLLQEIHDAPALLFVRGDVNLISSPQLAIVGSRNPSPGGIDLAEQFASCLAEAGLVITSGLALGIDAASHRGALNVGRKTIAVCGAGLRHVYPYSHRQLAQEILVDGALVSEFPPATLPKAKHFPMRNRIISGLSLGVLVVEAAVKSGSLITARNAVEQGREVFAIPGSIHNPLSRGCHQLIRQGAKLVEIANDILEELGALKAIVAESVQKSYNLDAKQAHVLTQIGYEITSLDAIILRSGLTVMDVSSMLLVLELEGYVTQVAGGYVRNLRLNC